MIPKHLSEMWTAIAPAKRIRAILTEGAAGDLNLGRKVALAGAGIVALVLPIFIGVIGAPTIRAQSQGQNPAATAPSFEYEVASIKPSKSGNTNWFGIGVTPTPDGFTAADATLQMLVSSAYGVGKFQISGAPDWFNSDKFDIDAKMDASVADALKKLSPDQIRIARQHMLQALLADRFKLVVRRETKDLPVYRLVIAKNGAKIQEAKPGDTYPNGIKLPAGQGGTGVTMMMGSGGITAQAIPIATLIRMLSPRLDRPILDSTGLTGKYDFTLRFSSDQSQPPATSENTPNSQPSLSTSDPSGPSLFTAIQEQLGLKLEPGKGPVETIVIDHVERPSGN